MKKKMFCCIVLLCPYFMMAQTDSTKKTITTTTTITESGNQNAQPAAPANTAAAPQQNAESTGGSDDYAKFYIGARFMPTFTKFEVKNLDNSVAQTTFVVGYGAGGYIGCNLSRNIGLQAEVIYSALSQKYTDKSLERTIDISYLYVPLLVVLNTDVSKTVNLNLAIGPQVGINTGSKISTSSGGEGVDSVTAVIAVKPADLGLAYGAGVDFSIGENLTLGIGFRGVYGILDISDKSKTTTTDQFYILDRSHVKTYAAYAGLALKF